jgi:hypothetical protein
VNARVRSRHFSEPLGGIREQQIHADPKGVLIRIKSSCSEIGDADLEPKATPKSRRKRAKYLAFPCVPGHFQTSSRVAARSVDPSTADMRRLHRHVGFVPKH